MKAEQTLIYPIIVSEEHDAGDYFIAESPNIPGMNAEGDSMLELVKDAQSAIATMLEDRPYPATQDPRKWIMQDNQKVVYVTVDMGAWLRNSQTVKRSISVPAYLNELAKRKHVNVSRIATDALKKELEG